MKRQKYQILQSINLKYRFKVQRYNEQQGLWRNIVHECGEIKYFKSQGEAEVYIEYLMKRGGKPDTWAVVARVGP